MEELQVNMLGSPHSNGLAAALHCCSKWPFSVQHVGVGQQEGCLVGPTHRGCAALHTANPQHRAAAEPLVAGSGCHQWRRQSATSIHPTLRG